MARACEDCGSLAHDANSVACREEPKCSLCGMSEGWHERSEKRHKFEPAPPAPPAAAALERYLPEGFAIGDDATAELAVELARAESELAALREEVEKLRSERDMLLNLLCPLCRMKWAAEAALREGQK